AHSKGIVHRDIKPANLMVTPRGQVKMLDFGVAKTAQPELPAAGDSPAAAHTAAGTMIGSLSHISPEQILGTHVDGRSDLFSPGVAMYEMATGRLPFTGTTRVELLDRICHRAPESIRSSRADVPIELERIVFRCLEKQPGQRYNSARALFDDLCELKRAL